MTSWTEWWSEHHGWVLVSWWFFVLEGPHYSTSMIVAERIRKFARYSIALRLECCIMTSQRLLKAFAGSYKEEKQCWIQDFVWGLSKYFAKAAHRAYNKSRLVYQCHPKHPNLDMTYAGRKSTYQTSWCMCMYSISRFRFPKPFWRLLKKQIQKGWKHLAAKKFRPWWIGGLVCWFGILGVSLERKCCLAIPGIPCHRAPTHRWSNCRSPARFACAWILALFRRSYDRTI